MYTYISNVGVVESWKLAIIVWTEICKSACAFFKSVHELISFFLDFSKIEKISAAFPKFPETKPVALGNAGLISLDPSEDKSTVYQDILDAYSWVKKVFGSSRVLLSCMFQIK